MYRVSTPTIVKWLFSSLTWNIPNDQNHIYLTFDDGPVKGVTDTLLDILDNKKVKASFFCLGKNIVENPKLFDRIKASGHTIGNHGFEHLNAWKTSHENYYENIKKSESYFNNKLFRPPYGKLRFRQLKNLSKKYDVILWDILSGDFDPRVNKQQCIDNVMNNLKPGSIIVFHDNQHSKNTMLNVIPHIIDQSRALGYVFQPLEFSGINNLPL